MASQEAAEVVAQVAPGVEVPVVAVVDEALRGDFAFGDAVIAPVVMADGRVVSVLRSAADGNTEPGGVDLRGARVERTANALFNSRPGVIAASQDGSQALQKTRRARLRVPSLPGCRLPRDWRAARRA